MKYCKYATQGCAHADNCIKQDVTQCGYYRYFKFLDENF